MRDHSFVVFRLRLYDGYLLPMLLAVFISDFAFSSFSEV